jgi:RNA polymerase sigma-70 factor (ECF subfamily)
MVPASGEAQQLDAALNAARSGDEDAFGLMYRALQPALLRYLYGLVGSDAEDVASESWLQIARDLRRFRGDWAAFRGWAVTIARHRALDHLQHQRRRPAEPTALEELIGLSGGADTAGTALDAIGTDAALALIASLPREQAEAILLRVVVGLDAPAAGRVLGRRAGAVRTAAYRGLRRLAEQLSRAPAAAAEGPVTPIVVPALKEVR